jgi:hypothetical protein
VTSAAGSDERGEETAPRVEHRTLLRHMHSALLSEVGSRTVYARLSKRRSHGELAQLLERLEQESAQVHEKLRVLMESLGGDPPRSSLRRRLLAEALAALSPLIGIRRVLRLCQHAEETVSRWYASYSAHLAEIGHAESARLCQELSLLKLLHAQALSAWVSNIRRFG